MVARERRMTDCAAAHAPGLPTSRAVTREKWEIAGRCITLESLEIENLDISGFHVIGCT